MRNPIADRSSRRRFAQPPPAHPGNSSFAGPLAPLVLRRRDARRQLRRSGRPAVREVSSEKRRRLKDRQEGRVRTPERKTPCVLPSLTPVR